MVKSCIICGGKAGSAEHVFPAALGGRRTNNGIYCGLHNRAYSNLAGIITEQLRFFNAQLGVVGDHSDKPTTATMTDVATGQQMSICSQGVTFEEPLLLATETLPRGTRLRMVFNSQKEIDDWIKRKEAEGDIIKSEGAPPGKRFHMGEAKKQFAIGGTEEGLRAVAYIAQTFLANSSAAVGRLPDLRPLKDYTLLNKGTGFVWWDFDPPDDIPTNKFQFGHRVLVGADAETGTIYSRVSFFSALNFALLLGQTTNLIETRTVITDIDPLALHAPNDIFSWSAPKALGLVLKPSDSTASLIQAISYGKAKDQVDALMARITKFMLQETAKRIVRQADRAKSLLPDDRDDFFLEIVEAEAQRILILMQYAAADCTRRAGNPAERVAASILTLHSRIDSASASGLPSETSIALEYACLTIARKMGEDFSAGRLDQNRVEMLIGGGPGAAIIAEAIVSNFSVK